MNESILTKVRDASTILSLLSSAKVDRAEVFVWRLIGNSKHLACVRIETIRHKKDFCIVPANGHDREVQDLMSSQGYIDLYIPSSFLLMRCTIGQTEAPIRYFLQIPQFVAQLDRRDNYRLNVYDEGEIQVSFSKSHTGLRAAQQRFHKACFDISSGGFSFFVSKAELRYFKASDPIGAIEVRSGKWAAWVNAEVTVIKEIAPTVQNGLSYKVWRICCRFVEMDRIGQKYLEKFILERIKEELRAINE